MTVKELIDELSKVNQNLNVMAAVSVQKRL